MRFNKHINKLGNTLINNKMFFPSLIEFLSFRQQAEIELVQRFPFAHVFEMRSSLYLCFEIKASFENLRKKNLDVCFY